MSIAINSVLHHADTAMPLDIPQGMYETRPEAPVKAADSFPALPTLSASVTAEQAFVARLKAGDEAAYEELVRTRGGHLLAVARRLLRDEDAACDAVQDTFLSAFRSIQRFDGHAQLSTCSTASSSMRR